MEENNLTRCFIAIDFPREVMDAVYDVQQELWKKKSWQGKLTENENLHLTLKFLGEIDEKKIGEVRKRLREIKFKKFNSRLGELGVFSPNFIKIAWIHVLGGKILELQKIIDEKLEGLFEKEERFMSHLTIARVKFVKDKKLFLEDLKKIDVPNIEFGVDSFYLMKSELNTNGPVYTDLEKYSLD